MTFPVEMLLKFLLQSCDNKMKGIGQITYSRLKVKKEHWGMGTNRCSEKNFVPPSG